MKKKKVPKTLKWKYNTIKIFCSTIIFLIFLCLIGAWHLHNNENEFGYSTLLNVFGGLFTGLILLSYQYLSNKHLIEANIVIEELKQLNEISMHQANELDFCTDKNFPSEEQMEDYGIEIDTILADNEGVSCALNIYNNEIRKVEKQFNEIKYFLNNILSMSFNISSYEEILKQTKCFFSNYSREVEYAIPPYLLRKHVILDEFEIEDDLIEIFKTEEEKNNYLKNNPDILNNSLYYIDPPGNLYEIEVVYKDNVEVLIEDIYKEWIKKMKDLENATKDFNQLFRENKEKVLSIHNRNSNIIH
ncbi:hypothetical protein [Clostridium sp. Marseille-QA1073]